MESNSFRKLLLIFALIIAIPVMNAIYGMISAVITGIIVLIAIIIILIRFSTRTGDKPKNRGICADIHSINIKINGRNYIIGEGAGFNLDDHEQPGIMSYVENGVWYICDSPTETPTNSIAEITIPQGFHFNAFDVALNSGNLLINSLNSKRFGIAVYGDFAEIKSLKTTSLTASAGKGTLILSTALTGNATLSCGSGTLDVSFDEVADKFNLEAQTGAGAILLNGDVIADSANRNTKLDRNSSHTIKASCGLGKLSINFSEVTVDDEI